MSFWSNLFPAPSYKNISVDELKDLPANVRVIDVRQAQEFNDSLGHLERAELVPMAQVSQAAQAWDKSAPLLIVCRSGGRSSQVAQMLGKSGFEQVLNLKGGLLAVRARQ